MGRATKEKKTARAEVYYGDETCREKSTMLLTEMGLPNWLIPFDEDIKEFGYVIETGFVWLKQRNRREYRIEEVEGKVLVYDSEITAYVEPKKIKKLTGVKTKELFVWITLSEILVDGSTGTITVKTPSGLSRGLLWFYFSRAFSRWIPKI
ncbi:uncharacterized protein LOC114300030 isoform X3 [Camellia sinensis]|uniref:uncharacterized protein LOC114300030 isoform X3 n=1 Tax=Camellia sinensis TaxID=4442 RepID=UPI0010366521|nr:uncharacterized protein LOC114300030 isoform X3 [Camellia sinensis]